LLSGTKLECVSLEHIVKPYLQRNNREHLLVHAVSCTIWLQQQISVQWNNIVYKKVGIIW